jgi:hypothetical protein
MWLQSKVVQEPVHEAAGGQRKAPGEMVIEDHRLSGSGSGDPFAASGMAAHEVRGRKHSTPAQQLDLLLLHPRAFPGSLRQSGWSSIFAVTAPFPLDRDTLGAIRVRIWMSGMVAK